MSFIRRLKNCRRQSLPYRQESLRTFSITLAQLSRLNLNQFFPLQYHSMWSYSINYYLDSVLSWHDYPGFPINVLRPIFAYTFTVWEHANSGYFLIWTMHHLAQYAKQTFVSCMVPAMYLYLIRECTQIVFDLFLFLVIASVYFWVIRRRTSARFSRQTNLVDYS